MKKRANPVMRILICTIAILQTLCGCAESVENTPEETSEPTTSEKVTKSTDHDTEKLVYPEYSEDELLNLSDEEMKKLYAVYIPKETAPNSRKKDEEFVTHEKSAENRKEADEIAKKWYTPSNAGYSFSEIKSAEEIDGIGWLYMADYSNHNVKEQPYYLFVFSKDFYDNGRLTAETTAENLELLISYFYRDRDNYPLLGFFIHDAEDKTEAVRYYFSVTFGDFGMQYNHALLIKRTITLDKNDGTVTGLSDDKYCEYIKKTDIEIAADKSGIAAEEVVTK